MVAIRKTTVSNFSAMSVDRHTISAVDVRFALIGSGATDFPTAEIGAELELLHRNINLVGMSLQSRSNGMDDVTLWAFRDDGVSVMTISVPALFNGVISVEGQVTVLQNSMIDVVADASASTPALSMTIRALIVWFT